MNQTNKGWEIKLNQLIFDSVFDIILPNINWENWEDETINGPEIEKLLYEKLENFTKETLALQKQKIIEVCELKEKRGENGEGLPFENSPDIYGNQRIESYKKGYNTAISEIISAIKNTNV